MNRVLLFPLAVAAVAALDGCQGVQITDPSVRACHDDTLQVVFEFSDGRRSVSPMIFHDDKRKCRPRAA